MSHIASVVGATVAGWFLVTRKVEFRIRAPQWGCGLIVLAVLIDALARALTGQSWQAPEFAASAFSAAVFFYLLLYLSDDGRIIACGLVLAAGVCCAMGLVWARQASYSQLALPLGNRTLMAGLLLLCAGPAVGLFLTWSDSRPRRIATLSACGLLLYGLLRTGSASALVVLATVAALLAMARLGKQLQWRAILVGIIAVTLAGVWSSQTSFEPIVRLRQIIQGGNDPTLSWNNRLRYWDGALPAFESRPLLGHGPGQVGDQYPRHRVQQPGQAPHGEILPDLHNTVLNWLFEFGLLGAGLRIGLFLVILIPAVRAPQPLTRWAGYSLGAYGAFSFFHYQLLNPGIVCALVCVAAIAVPATSSIRIPARGAFGLGLVLISSAAASSGLWLRTDHAWLLFERSKTASTEAATSDLLRSASLDGRGGTYDYFAALRLERSPPDAGSPALQRARQGIAALHYRRATDGQPYMPIMMATYGRFLLREGQQCESIDTLVTAVSLDFYFSMAHYDLANAYRLCGNPKMATAEAAIAILTQPELSFSTAWQDRDAEFLPDYLVRARGWAAAWRRIAGQHDNVLYSALLSFLDIRLAGLSSDDPIVAELNLSDAVGMDLPGDPFAFLVQRRSPYFVITEIPLSAPASGSWAPNGIGAIRELRAVSFEEVREAYRREELDSFVRSLEPDD